MAEREYKIRLISSALPPGQIPATELAGIAESLQIIAQRLARQMVGAEGRGRTPAALERAAQVMFTGVSAGSTVLEYRLGDPNVLGMEDSPDESLGLRFDRVLQGIVDNTPPPQTSALVANAAQRLATALSGGFPSATIEISTPSFSGSCAAENIDSTVWSVSDDVEVRSLTVNGTLNRIDLRSNAFRVTDSAGNDIALHEVPQPESFGPLIGKFVTATGLGEFVNGRLVGLTQPVIEPLELPSSWIEPQETTPLQRGGTFGAGVEGISDDEIAAFLATL